MTSFYSYVDSEDSNNGPYSEYIFIHQAICPALDSFW